jgi:hypothetical protein
MVGFKLTKINASVPCAPHFMARRTGMTEATLGNPALARAHARTGDAATIWGYMGSSRTFDDAICEFAVDYTDQTMIDHRAFTNAIREGRIKAFLEQ